jgi:NAD(P)-dependent dehydrogenase (short-subunit alcohol dehydrogenase family)
LRHAPYAKKYYERLRTCSRRRRERGGRASAYEADAGDYDAVCDAVARTVADSGGIDILINNAGYVERAAFLETTPDGWHRQIDVGLYGVIHCCHAVIPHMSDRKGGRIVNVVGDSARVGEAALAITAASRGGVLALTKFLAKELGPRGITINVIALGLVDTSHTDKAWLQANLEKIVRLYPLRRIGQPTDVTPLAALPASDAAAWITGQVISVNGGYSMVG